MPESNKSDRSQCCSGIGVIPAFDILYTKAGTELKRWSGTYWSALADTKWCCKSRHNHDEWPTI